MKEQKLRKFSELSDEEQQEVYGLLQEAVDNLADCLGKKIDLDVKELIIENKE